VRYYLGLRWRQGRKVGRTLYAQLGPEPSDNDPLIGVLDTPELAEQVVRDRENARHLAAALDALNIITKKGEKYWNAPVMNDVPEELVPLMKERPSWAYEPKDFIGL
jgi:hypothetical protein